MIWKITDQLVFKIIPFIFARRWQTVISKQIGNEKTAYIKSQFTGINACFVLDIFRYCENFNKEGILLFKTLKKLAFDSAKLNFLKHYKNSTSGKLFKLEKTFISMSNI